MKALIPLYFLMSLSSLAFAGELVFKPSSINLEVKPDQKEYKGVFVFENKGEKPIKVLGVKGSCGCLLAKIAVKTYQPGESGQIAFTIQLNMRQLKISKAIKVDTDEDSEYDYRLNCSFYRESLPELPQVKKVVTRKKMKQQTTCPFMDIPLNLSNYVDYEGKRIYTCCKDCLAIVKANPQTAIDILSAKGQYPVYVINAPAAK
jgi:hypothetical protein